MQKFRLPFLLFLISSIPVFSQYNGLGFSYPLDREPVVTGNYAELRPNHFHAGLDFSTDPVLNLPIKSVADGYISRIKISSGGYGKVLYVTHPNGYVTVYAHERRFAEKINSYLVQKQLEQKKNEIELFPGKDELPVKKGEVIGYTGNTGSSTGPHLHFEVREEKSEIPINPLLLYNIKDDIKPVVTNVAIYNTADSNSAVLQTSAAFNTKLNKLSLSNNTFLLPQNTFALAFSGYDLTNSTTNKNNIYEAKIELDGKIIYHHQLDHISFDNARYVNVFSEKAGSIKYQKCFAPSCYDIAIYKTLVNGGKIELKDTIAHVVELTVSDEKGNHTNLVFYLKAKAVTGYQPPVTKNNAFCAKEFVLKQGSYEMIIPPGALTNNTYIHQLVFIKAPVGGGIEVGNRKEQFLKPYKMALKITNVPEELQSKLVMLVNGEVVNGKYADGWLRAEPKALGNFKYMYDTVNPTITYALSKSKTLGIKGRSSVSFKVGDAMSGIADYNLFINETWQIVEYDAKSATITCYFNEQTPKGSINIRLTVTDKVGNAFTYDVYTVR